MEHYSKTGYTLNTQLEKSGMGDVYNCHLATKSVDKYKGDFGSTLIKQGFGL